MQFYPSKSNIPEERVHRLFLTGVDGAAPVVAYGKGMAIARTGEGAYTVTWGDNPGTFLGMAFAFGDSTPGDVKTYTGAYGTYSASTGLPIVFYNSGTAADLIETEMASLTFYFAQTTSL